MMQARSRLPEAVTRDQLLAVFAQTGLERLGRRIVGEAPGPVQGFSLGRARREIAHLYRDRLLRVQFFTGIVGLLAIAALGWTQDYLHISKFAIPTGPALVAALVLVLLFVTLGRLATDYAAKLLLERIAELPFRSGTNRTFLIAAEGDRVGTGFAAGSLASPVGAVGPIVDAIKGLIQIIERDGSSLREPIMHLSASAEALAAMAKAVSEHPAALATAAGYAATGEELKTAIDRLTTKIEQLAERPADEAPAASLATGEELKTAIDRLASRIEELAGTTSRRSAGLHGDFQEVRDLLKEFE